MRWVPHAAISPHRCAVIPYVGNSNTNKGFIDTGMDLPGWDPHVYVSVEAVEEMARLCGWEPQHVVSGEQGKVARLEAQVAELEAELAEADRFREATEYTLGQFGSKVRAKPGRKPAEKAVG